MPEHDDHPPPNVVALPHGRVPPHNLDAERALLGGILLDPAAFNDIRDLVAADEFYRDAHRKVFEAMCRLDADGVAIDRITVKKYLDVKDPGPRAELEDLVDVLDNYTPTAANLAYYAKIVRDKGIARDLIEVSTSIAQLGYEQHGDVEQFVAHARSSIDVALERAPQKPSNRFELAHTRLTVTELTVDPPPLEFILRPYVPAETVSVLSGPGGSNKTTLTSLLAVSRALGRRMLRDLVPRAGETVILTTEDRKAHYRRKFAAIREHLGPEYDAKAVAERVHILDMAGLPVRLILADRGEQFRPSPEVDELAEALRRVAPRADHVVIETISRVTGGVESNAAMSVLVTACERLALLSKVAVTLVGHVGQNTARAGIADAYAGRGGSALGDNARSSLVLMPLNDKNASEYASGLEISDDDMEHTLVLTQPKRNGTAASESPPRLLRRMSTRFGPVLDDALYAHKEGAPADKPKRRGPKAALTYAETRAAILAYVKKHQPASGNAVIQDIGGNRTNARALISDLVRDRLLDRDAASRLILGPGPITGTNSQNNSDPKAAGPVGPITSLPLRSRGEREEVIGLTTGSDSHPDSGNRTQHKDGEVF